MSTELKTSAIPQFFPAYWVDEMPEIVFTDFPSRIRIGYVVRENGSYWYVLKELFDDLGLSVEELHEAALANLAALPSGRITVAKPPDGVECWITADDNFAAARILLPEVREAFAAELGPEFLLALPHRDWCICWSRSQSPERQAKHAAEALTDFVNDDYRLTPDILLSSVEGFRLHGQQAVS